GGLFLFFHRLAHLPANLLAITTSASTIFHNLTIALVALLGAAVAGLCACLVSIPGQRARASGKRGGQDAEVLAVPRQLESPGMMLAMIGALHLQVLETVMGRFVAGLDALTDCLHVPAVLMMLMFLVVQRACPARDGR